MDAEGARGGEGEERQRYQRAVLTFIVGLIALAATGKERTMDPKKALKVKQNIRKLADELEQLVESRMDLKKENRKVFEALTEINDAIEQREVTIKQLARSISIPGETEKLVDRDLVKIIVQGKEEYDLEKAKEFFTPEAIEEMSTVRISAEKVKKLLEAGELDEDDVNACKVPATPAVSIKLG